MVSPPHTFPSLTEYSPVTDTGVVTNGEPSGKGRLRGEGRLGGGLICRAVLVVVR